MRRRLAIAAGLICAGLLAVCAAAFAWHQAQSSEALRRYPPPGRLIEVAPGVRLHLHCVGAGSPTVVFEAGMSGWSADWRHIQRAVAGDVRACAYDRAGYGWSDPATGPADAQATASRLRRLLAAAGVEPPFLLVGHSLGGLYAQGFAARFPGDVAGLVLVDSVHRRQSAAMPAAIREQYEQGLLRLTRWSAALAPSGLLRLARQPASIVAHRLDPDVREAAVAFAYRSVSYEALSNEMAAFRATQAQVGPVPRGLPVTVLLASEVRDYPPGFGPAEKRVWNALQPRHAPGGNAVQLVAGSGHYIHLDRPAVVVASIRAHLAAGR